MAGHSGDECSEAEEEESIYSEEEREWVGGGGGCTSNLWRVRGLSLFGGASSEVRRYNCSVVVKMRASFLPEIYLSIYLSRASNNRW